MTHQNGQNYRFDEFELDMAKRRLLREGEVVALQPKVFDLLAVLVENNGRLVSKDDIFRLVWGGQFVEETNLTVGVSAIRRALGETASKPRYITNVSGRGYYFSGDLHDGTNGNGDMLVESRSVSTIVVETEITDDHKAVMPRPAGTSVRQRARILVALGALLIGVLVAGYFGFFRSGGPGIRGFSITRLTTTGRADTVAVSPDGHMFAFSQVEPAGKHSLWLSQIDGSGQIQLRPPSEKPIASTYFSPDGSRIYFVQFEANTITNGTIFRIPVIGGVAEKVKEGVLYRIALSPDGKEVAFLRRDPLADRSTLVIAAVDGPTERELASRPISQGGFTSMMDWSPDGTTLAIGALTTSMDPGPAQIFTVNVNTGDVRQISREGWHMVKSLGWAPDGRGVFASVGYPESDLERQIWYVPVDGKPERLLADSNGYGSLDISADGSVIVATQFQSVGNVWVAPANDLAAGKQVTFDMLGKQTGWSCIDWTPDGEIIYSGRIGKNDTIWTMAADGGSPRQLIATSGRNEYCSVPDDGRFVVFTSNRTGQKEIWRSGLDGSDLKQLTFDGDYESPHVSPDGRFIVYNRGRGPDKRLWRISIDGGTPVRLTDEPADWARFSPDGRQVACAYETDGKAKLAVIDADGGKPLRTFDVPENANFRLSVRWTPDGKAVTYRDWLNGIWRQPVDGGKLERLAGLPEEKLFAYAWSRDGKWFAYARGTAMSDAVLLTSLK